MSTTRHITAADGHRFEAARADPAGKPKGGIIILHAIYGLTDHMRGVCDRWAEAGYAAVAPALYDRVGPGLVHAYTGDGPAAGRKCYEMLTGEHILADISACRDDLAASGPVCISGFCTGGTWAWVAAAKLDGLAAQVNFYGSHVAARHLDVSPACPTLMHYGDSDHIVPLPDIERIRASHPKVEIDIYPGAGHAFFNPEQDHYDERAAGRAWQRSLTFLEKTFA